MLSNPKFTQVMLYYTFQPIIHNTKKQYGWINLFVNHSQVHIVRDTSIGSTYQWELLRELYNMLLYDTGTHMKNIIQKEPTKTKRSLEYKETSKGDLKTFFICAIW